MCQCLPGQCIFADMDVVLAQSLQPLTSSPTSPGHEFPPQIHSSSFRAACVRGRVRGRVELLADNLRKSLALIAPTCEALLKSRKNGWIQLSGHAGAFFPAGPDTIWKKRLSKDNNETNAYKSLMTEPLSLMVPHYYGEVQYNDDYFIEMEDLLQHFTEPCVMDIKMGTRTFLESEVSNPAVRSDLYEKLVKLSPGEVSAEESKVRAVTKLRYMTCRERESSTSTLGFRVEGVKLSQSEAITSSNLKKIKTREQVHEVMRQYLSQSTERTLKELIERLRMLRQRFEESPYFKTHEIIGSSLLLIYDSRGSGAVKASGGVKGGEAVKGRRGSSMRGSGVWMIDFAKTVVVPPPCTPLTHRSQWALGNHEDGYLTGLDNLILILEEIHCKQ